MMRRLPRGARLCLFELLSAAEAAAATTLARDEGTFEEAFGALLRRDYPYAAAPRQFPSHAYLQHRGTVDGLRVRLRVQTYNQALAKYELRHSCEVPAATSFVVDVQLTNMTADRPLFLALTGKGAGEPRRWAHCFAPAPLRYYRERGKADRPMILAPGAAVSQRASFLFVRAKGGEQAHYEVDDCLRVPLGAPRGFELALGLQQLASPPAAHPFLISADSKMLAPVWPPGTEPWSGQYAPVRVAVGPREGFWG